MVLLSGILLLSLVSQSCIASEAERDLNAVDIKITSWSALQFQDEDFVLQVRMNLTMPYWSDSSQNNERAIIEGPMVTYSSIWGANLRKKR